MSDTKGKVEAPVVGQLYNVVYIPDLERETGFLNLDGVHVAYSANAGQVYFRRIKDDGARSHLAYDNPCVESFQILETKIYDDQERCLDDELVRIEKSANREFSKVFGKS